MLGKDYERQDCSLARALETIGERWTLLIVRDSLYGVRRFNEFQAHLDVPKAVLSDRLAGLVQDGVLERRPDPDHAGRHLYELTEAASCGRWFTLCSCGAIAIGTPTVACSSTRRVARRSTKAVSARSARSDPRRGTS